MSRVPPPLPRWRGSRAWATVTLAVRQRRQRHQSDRFTVYYTIVTTPSTGGKAVAGTAEMRVPRTTPKRPTASEPTPPPTPSAAGNSNDLAFEIEDMPEPVYRKEDGRKPLVPAEITAARPAWRDDRDREEIAASLRAAERRRARREAQASGGDLRPGEPDDQAKVRKR